MRQPLLAIEALRLYSAVTEHFGNLCVLLAVLAEDEFALVVVVLVLSTSPVLASLESRTCKSRLRGTECQVSAPFLYSTTSRRFISTGKVGSSMEARTFGIPTDNVELLVSYTAV